MHIFFNLCTLLSFFFFFFKSSHNFHCSNSRFHVKSPLSSLHVTQTPDTPAWIWSYGQFTLQFRPTSCKFQKTNGSDTNTHVGHLTSVHVFGSAQVTQVVTLLYCQDIIRAKSGNQVVT